MPSKELLDKYKIKNPNGLWGAVHKESRQHYIQGKLNPMITVPNTSLREFSKMMRDECESKDKRLSRDWF